jgi:hypothetical protein
VREELAGPDLE